MRQAIVALLILMSIVSALMLSGCQEQVFPAQAVSLTEQENNLLTSVGVKRYFVFDIDRKQIEFDNIEFAVIICVASLGNYHPLR